MRPSRATQKHAETGLRLALSASPRGTGIVSRGVRKSGMELRKRTEKTRAAAGDDDAAMPGRVSRTPAKAEKKGVAKSPMASPTPRKSRAAAKPPPPPPPATEIDNPPVVGYHIEMHVSTLPWKGLLLRAFLALVFGGLCLYDPLDGVYSVALCFAGFVLADGGLTSFYAVKGMLNRDLRIGVGLFRLIAGLLGIAYGIAAFVTNLEVEAVIFSRLVASLIVLRGVAEVASAVVLYNLPEGEMIGIGRIELASFLVLGIVEMGWGIMVMRMFPAVAVFTVASLIGVWAIFNGLRLVAMSYQTRKLEKLLGTSEFAAIEATAVST